MEVAEVLSLMHKPPPSDEVCCMMHTRHSVPRQRSARLEAGDCDGQTRGQYPNLDPHYNAILEGGTSSMAIMQKSRALQSTRISGTSVLENVRDVSTKIMV
jgi:hypothetical protein